jgi:catechol 2,3-dioxygenase-like lactoylglutathione lyase family enzyme
MAAAKPTPRLGLVGLVVGDMAKSLGFYRSLGLAIPAEHDTLPHVEYILASGVFLAWDHEDLVRSFDPDFVATPGRGRVALAFVCESGAAVDAVYAQMVALGHRGHKPPWDAFWGQRYAILLDPDGNTVDVYADLPAAEPANLVAYE